MKTQQTFKIILVDDHELFRQGLALVINNLGYVKVIAEASNGNELIKILEVQVPDIILMDINMPGMNGVVATQKVLEKYPDLKIVALTMFSDEEYLHSMISAGARGFILKDIKKADLERAINIVAEGKNYFSEELLGYLTKKYVEPEKSSDSNKLISRREYEILQHVATGMTNQEIAEKLNLSIRTVEGHKTNLIEKTGSKNIVDLLIYAIKNNIVKI